MSYKITAAELAEELSYLRSYKIVLINTLNKLGKVLHETYPTLDTITSYAVKLGHTTLLNAVSTAGGPFTGWPNYFGSTQRRSVIYDYTTATFTPTVSTIVVEFIYPSNSARQNMFPVFPQILQWETITGTTTATYTRYYPQQASSSSTTNIYRRVGGRVSHPSLVSGPDGANATLPQTFYYPFQVKFGIRNTDLYDRIIDIPIDTLSATYFNDFVTYLYKYTIDCIPLYQGIWPQYSQALRTLYFVEERMIQVERMIFSLSGIYIPYPPPDELPEIEVY